MIRKNNKWAAIFPGQSSQHVGMLSDLSIRYALIKRTFSEVSEILNYDIWKLIQNGPIAQLNQTCYAQPAILTTSVIIWKIWQEEYEGPMPKIMAGHSLGEYSALVCAGSMELLSAVKLIMIRSILMQEASPFGHGAMSVIIGLNKEIVIKLCKMIESKHNQIVAPAVFNAPQNIVIAGHIKSVKKVNLICKDLGAKYVSILPISVPSHCGIMKSIVNQFQEELKKIIIYPPKIPVINNTNLCIETEPESIRNALVCQLYTPVRWDEIIQKFLNKNIQIFLEIGPSKVLTQLIKRSVNNVLSLSINDFKSLSMGIEYVRSINNQ